MRFTRTKSIIIATALFVTFVSTEASSAAPNPQALSSTFTSIPGVSVDASGTFHYTNSLASPQDLSGAVTSVVQGTRDASGACVFSDPNSAGAKFGTEIAYNPTTCQDTMVSGQLTAKGAADLAAISPATTTSPATTKFASRAAQSSAVVSPASYNGYWAAYNKLAFIDPFNFTVVSTLQQFHMADQRFISSVGPHQSLRLHGAFWRGCNYKHW